ncbi:aldehyde dehydrogenase (NADP(+)) [Fimbriimonas ginsengisoli]|uniref:Aldehyde Dehydrogenase n=1 Tax=Fimbriimonas ginsengisoli Gsoil 348 TaxID=661478 RepID=A0A068NN83_FIMGI|nr:aldehyde dehydrogenase (NADP(+)) [Fimbriimonas ginsengisoli]AIE84205.1 Aldehyde Dehydrogenase [Fimbriimonas ginsengisoli Gsoil 348]
MLDVSLSGSNFIGSSPSADGAERIRASARQDGRPLEPEFIFATPEEVAEAARKAAAAFPVYASLTSEARASFLEAIASGIERLGDPLIERAHAESGLPLARLTGERGRTCGQLRMFAALIREGSWVDARIDLAQPDRAPVPKPDIRRMLMPIGPVAVFGASNFPLAFSVAGGDTASALASGCPVIVKGHPAHPGTSEMVARAILAAAEASGMPDGVFSLVHGGAEVGRELVERPEIEAVAFTGSRTAGRALYNLAAARPRPIPVFAEMGSVNPLFVLPGALAERGEAISKGYADSLVMGVGQFCTNPGILIGIDGEAFESMLWSVAAKLGEVAPGTMLTDAICERYDQGVAAWSQHSSLTALFFNENRAAPALFSTSAEHFLQRPELAEELFGPGAIAVRCQDFDELVAVAQALHGQLTASVHRSDADDESLAALLPVLAGIAGRVVVDGFPTGVEVCPSMQHGGPYPATTDSRSTSVGTAAIFRFVRPVAFQNLPNRFLPAELQDGNPRGIWRLIDGTLQR